MKINFSRVLALGLISLFVFFSAMAQAQTEDPIVTIDKALSRGQINFEEALNRKIDAVFRQKFLRMEPLPSFQIKTATYVLKEAVNKAYLLTAENRFILDRPTDPTDEDYYGTGSEVWTYESPHFVIHYTEDNSYGNAVPGADGFEETVPWYVSTFAEYFEESWEFIVDRHSYLSPPSDNGRGANDKFDVYIIDMYAYGYCAIDQAGFPYIVVENDYDGFPLNLDPEGRQKGAMKISAAHEFFHAVQYQYDQWSKNNRWWFENSAVWMEDEIFDEVDDYINYVGLRYDDENDNGKWDSGETYYNLDGSVAGTEGRLERWSDRPELPLDTFNGSHEYGGVVWAKYLVEKHGAQFPRNILERLLVTDGALTAISEELESREDSFVQALKEFRLKNLFRDYEEGQHYPLPKHFAAITSYPATVTSPVSYTTIPIIPPSSRNRLRHLASEYISFKPDTAESVTFTVSLAEQNIADFSLMAVRQYKTGGVEIEEIELDPHTGEGSLEIADFVHEYSKLVVLPLNLSRTSDWISYKIYAQASGTISPPEETFLYFPLVAGNPDWWAGILLLNPGDLAAVTVYLYDNHGHQLHSTSFDLQGWEKKVILMRDLFAETPIPSDGWLKVVSSNSRLTGIEVWGSHDGAQLSAIAGVPVSDENFIPRTSIFR